MTFSAAADDYAFFHLGDYGWHSCFTRKMNNLFHTALDCTNPSYASNVVVRSEVNLKNPHAPQNFVTSPTQPCCHLVVK
ncbi:hypothetical protein TNIN_394341 [Trichonephila inaurata madagascariensis]|uniref:Uncharacterized protein n=1 Tax=Trichonephila inaurata madagascariensis TaxID=2747483 RepID=A0A8X6Y6L8_9ARAC|nr:hypothetical protein TNIN_394341 [Trichonephila inaurata madagascariensis]